MIQCALEMLVEDNRYAARLAEAAIGEPNAVALNERRRSSFVCVCHNHNLNVLREDLGFRSSVGLFSLPSCHRRP